jgi:VanZ family protein
LSLISEPNSSQSVRCETRKEASQQPATRLITTSPIYHVCIPRRVIGALAILTLCGILAAGLCPFHSPKNQVHWLDNENGLRFGEYGTILSSGIFEGGSSDGPPCTLEIWLEPDLPWSGGTLVSFYSSFPPRQFSLHQSHADLALQRDFEDLHHQDQRVVRFADEIFRKKPLFVTVTSDGRNAAVYIDGRLVTRLLGFGLSIQDLTGKLIIANSPLQNDGWSGQLRGLAIYGSKLNAAQVTQHYEDWTQKGKPTVAQNERALGLYLLDERSGAIIHNQARPGIDLYIPERYLVVDQMLLEPPWKEFHTQWSYLKDVLVNIAGFVPLGFFFYAYFSSAPRMTWAAVATVILGSLFSLTIEVLQAHLPTRDSGVTDIITNTLGTYIGVIFYRAAALPLGRVLA